MLGKLMSRVEMPSSSMLVALCALVAGMAGVAVAAIPDSGSGLITGCYRPSTGSLSVVDAQAGKRCAGGEKTLTWNKQGAPGPQGAACLPADPRCIGPKGATGDAGDPCRPSDALCVGPKGESGDKGDGGDACLPSDPLCVGPKGDAGDKGDDGPAGPAGPTGPQGIPGPVAGLGMNTGSAARAVGRLCTLGDITLTASDLAGGTPAAGQVLGIATNPALFSLVGTTYGGDGVRTFALPDLRPITPNGKTYAVCTEGVFPTRVR